MAKLKREWTYIFDSMGTVEADTKEEAIVKIKEKLMDEVRERDLVFWEED